MIPATHMEPEVESPLPACKMPASDEITEEGFGSFRGTWFIGRAPVAEAQEIVRAEAEIMHWLDRQSSSAEEFEHLAAAIEKQDVDLLPEPLRSAASAGGLEEHLLEQDLEAPLGGLEIGVAGLVYTLSAVQCLTAASCRWHVGSRSWADCPVIFFVAPSWRVEILSGLIASEGCGLSSDRGMLIVYGASIRQMHGLAERVLSERGRFRRMPTGPATIRGSREKHQLKFF
jgi:hypothetical protein